MEADAFSGTSDEPKVYGGSVTVNISTVDLLENAEIRGDLVIIGTPSSEVELLDIVVDGDLDISSVEGNVNIADVTVRGETIY